MYLESFGLSRSAFPTAPVSECFFGFTQTQLNLEALQSGIDRKAGPGILIGPSGTGKTMIQSVLEDLNKNRHKTIRINASSCTSRPELIQTLLFELGYSYELSNLNLSRLELYSNLKDSPEFESGILLLVDDAHHLDGTALEELESLSEIYRNSDPTIQMILAGNSSLEEKLVAPALDSFNQKIATRSYLHGVDLCQLGDYLSFQLDRAGGKHLNLFNEDAIIAIHTATFGNIRLINQLCDFCLVNAAKSRVQHIDGVFVQKSWSLWQQIPTNEPEHSDLNDCDNKTDSSIIAFGSLENGDDPLAALAGLENDFNSKDTVSAGPALNHPPLMDLKTEETSDLVEAQNVAQQAQEKIETLITFAFEQDIQKPKQAAEKENRSSAAASQPSVVSSGRESISRDIPAGLMSSWSPTPVVTKAPAATQKKQKVETPRIVKPATDPPVVDCVAKAKHSISQIDSMIDAIDSLDSDWNEVEKVLAESDLEIANKTRTILPEETISAAEVPSTVKPITQKNKGELFGDDRLYRQSEVILNDVDWTQFLKPLDKPNESEGLVQKPVSTEETLDVPAQGKIETEASSSELGIVSFDRPQKVAPPNMPVETNHHPQSDDRRIITPAKAEDGEDRRDQKHELNNPKLAKRKDLRALLTSLRGF